MTSSMTLAVSHTASAFRYSGGMGRLVKIVRSVSSVLAALMLILGLSGCGDGKDSTQTKAETASDQVQASRFARRYVPFDPEWISETLIPMAPPISPQMVIWEVSEFGPEDSVTPEQRWAGNDFIRRCMEAALANGWFDQAKGIADGFVTLGSDARHHRNDAFVMDGIQLDPERPEYLMYYPDPNRDGEQTLTGLMFLANDRVDPGHQFAGPLSVWHYHKYTNARCWKGGGLLSTGMVDDDGNCPTGEMPRHRSPEMVHVWLIEHPRGHFSTGMTLPEQVLRAGLAKRRAAVGY